MFLSLLFVSNAQAKTYRFVGTSFPHILEKNPSGEVVGVAADLIKKIMTRLGHDVEITIYPWKRAQSMVVNGQADVLIGPYKTKQREILFNFSQYHFYQDDMVFYRNRKQDFSWNGTLASLSDISIGVMAGWAYGDVFDAHKAQLNTVTVYSLSSCFNMLSAKRISVCALNQRNAKQYLKLYKQLNDFKQVEIPISFSKGYFAFSKKRELTQLKVQFDQVLKEFINSNEVTRINKAYNLDYTKN